MPAGADIIHRGLFSEPLTILFKINQHNCLIYGLSKFKAHPWLYVPLTEKQQMYRKMQMKINLK